MTCSSDLRKALKPFELPSGRQVSWAALRRLLPDIETALFFGKVYHLNFEQLSQLIRELFKSSVMEALTSGDHSIELQDYLVEVIPTEVYEQGPRPGFVPAPPQSEVLAQLFEAAELTIAKSIADVADKLSGVLDALPGKEGRMTFQHLMKMNRQRPTIGQYSAAIHHERVDRNLVILDVSGSMTPGTIRAIVDDVVALSYSINAALAIVSNSTFVWDPNTFSSDDVLDAAEFGGTYYETLVPLLQEDWGTVVTIADYDSSRDAFRAIEKHCKGSVGKVIDISLVNRPTYLAECVGQLAQEVEPVLIADSYIR